MAIGKSIKRLDISSLRMDGNPRTSRGMKLEKLQASFETHGYQADSAIMVEEVAENDYLVLRGNRRTAAAQDLQKNNSEVFDRVFSDGKIPAIVCKGLTDQERILLRIDHSDELDREPLDDEGLFNAVLQLCKIGLKQEQIAKHLNLWKIDKATKKRVPNRSLVQRRVELAKLPQKVQDEFRVLFRDGQNATPVRVSQIPALYKEYNSHYLENPDGTIKFWDLWDDCCTPKEDKEGKPAKAGQALSPKKATEFAQMSQSKTVRNCLLAVTGQGQVTLEEVDRTAILAETAQVTLEKIKNHLGDKDYNDFLTEVFQATKEATPEEVEA